MKPKQKLHRVIRDVRDADRDYWVTTAELAQLIHDDLIIQVNCYNGRWDWAEK